MQYLSLSVGSASPCTELVHKATDKGIGEGGARFLIEDEWMVISVEPQFVSCLLRDACIS